MSLKNWGLKILSLVISSRKFSFKLKGNLIRTSLSLLLTIILISSAQARTCYEHLKYIIEYSERGDAHVDGYRKPDTKYKDCEDNLDAIMDEDNFLVTHVKDNIKEDEKAGKKKQATLKKIFGIPTSGLVDLIFLPFRGVGYAGLKIWQKKEISKAKKRLEIYRQINDQSGPFYNFIIDLMEQRLKIMKGSAIALLQFHNHTTRLCKNDKGNRIFQMFPTPEKIVRYFEALPPDRSEDF